MEINGRQSMNIATVQIAAMSLGETRRKLQPAGLGVAWI
jgi:hypothetical protein